MINIKSNILVSLVIGTLLVFGGLFFAVRSTSAFGFDGYTVCHVPQGNPDNAQTLHLGLSGYLNHLFNHPLDYAGECEEEEPEPSPSPSPSPEPCEEDGKDCEEPSPSPEPVVENQSLSAPTAPTCPDGNTTNVVANLHVLRAGADATVNFFITEGNNASIFYSVVGQPHWQYAVADVKPNADNFVSYTIHDLDPNLGYDFGAQQRQGCGGGQTTGIVVDGPATQLFGLSYWE